MASIIIRTAVEEDISQIVRFNAAMAKETEGVTLNIDVLEKGVKSVFNKTRNGFYLVAQKDIMVVACLMITYEWSDWRNGMFWWIQSVYVHQPYRRQGLFKLMYQEVAESARNDKSCVGLRLYVDKDNLNAQATYQTLGMKRTNYELFEVLL